MPPPSGRWTGCPGCWNVLSTSGAGPASRAMTEAARRIRMLALDVDGVLTDNGVHIGVVGGQRVEFKHFGIQDGLGLALLRGVSLQVAWVSARPSDATTLRATELKISEVIQAPDGRKVPPMQAMLDRLGLGWDEVAFV